MYNPPHTHTHQRVQISAGQSIAQLLLLLYQVMGSAASETPRGVAHFHSSDVAFWVKEIKDSRPTKTLKVQEKKILGLLNTSADISCISGKDWPKSWDMCIPPSSLIVLHQAHHVTRSSGVLRWSDGENSGTFHPHVTPVLLVIFGVETCYDRWECCCLLQMVLYPPKCYRCGLTLERALVNLCRAELCPLFQRLKMIDILGYA